MDPKVLDQINAATIIIFLVLAIGIVAKIGSRFLRYRREGLAVPDLLPRDLLLWIGLVVPFLGVLFFRATGTVAKDSFWYPLWIIGTDILGLAAVAYWAYFEYFKIEKK